MQKMIGIFQKIELFIYQKLRVFHVFVKFVPRYTPKELQSLPEEEKINKLALHNLISIKAEVDRVKEIHS